MPHLDLVLVRFTLRCSWISYYLLYSYNFDCARCSPGYLEPRVVTSIFTLSYIQRTLSCLQFTLLDCTIIRWWEPPRVGLTQWVCQTRGNAGKCCQGYWINVWRQERSIHIVCAGKCMILCWFFPISADDAV
jgi:hypothetical protein